MFTTLKLPPSTPAMIPATAPNYAKFARSRHRDLLLRRRPLHLSLPLAAPESAQPEYASEPSTLSQYTPSVGSSPLQLSQWNLTQRHILMLNAAVSATWLFFSAIPTLLAFKRAAESLEKLMDVTRKELPDTMAAVRLSGMEISDLTMELSDLGQEITQGVRSSTRAVRIAEERLRGLTNMSPPALVQEVASRKTDEGGPVLARTARGIKEGVVKGRMVFQMFFTLTRFSKMALNYFASRAKK
ncbi:hypothetical protein LWI28_023600 [Acer negundo]|uniref:Transmembrane protein n=1 Tax=Acer negundo TaxID=4023 RepID=A0AAD5IJC2_ACENE|nr:hypothetical protein LWI28_023600 [Acer negundo]